MEGLNADYTIKNWITKYIAVLFLRQYSIQPHLITMKPLELPLLPKTQSEKKVWLKNIDFLKLQIARIMTNSDLLSRTKLDFITTEWLEKNNKPKPTELIDLYKVQIEDDYEKTEIEQKISNKKKDEFENTSRKIISKSIVKFKSISNPIKIKNNVNNWFIHGERAVVDKSSFSDDQDTHHMNFDSFLAEHIATKFQQGISETFFHTKSKTYLLKQKDIFPAIDKLNLSKDYLLVSFAQNLEMLSVNGLQENSYKGIKLIKYGVSNYHLVGQSIFILKKSDLPNINHLQIEQSEIDKYSLGEIDDEFRLYSSVINLQKKTELLEELKPSHPDKDLRKYVLLNLILKTEIKWKKNINNIMIKTYSEYRERGVPDTLKDIQKIK
jgi:hypothetical protein